MAVALDFKCTCVILILEYFTIFINEITGLLQPTSHYFKSIFVWFILQYARWWMFVHWLMLSEKRSSSKGKQWKKWGHNPSLLQADESKLGEAVGQTLQVRLKAEPILEQKQNQVSSEAELIAHEVVALVWLQDPSTKHYICWGGDMLRISVRNCFIYKRNNIMRYCQQ